MIFYVLRRLEHVSTHPPQPQRGMTWFPDGSWQRGRAAAAATAVRQTRPDFGIPGVTETSTLW